MTGPFAGAALGLILGAIAGSFAATVLVRWPEGRSIGGRSCCDGCGAALGVADLVPILSFAARRGRCARCGGAIDRRHLAVEIAAAAIGAASLALLDVPAGLAAALFGWWLLLIACLDFEHQWLPDALTLPLIPAGLAVAWAGIGPAPGDRLVGAAAGFACLWLIAFAYRRIRGREGMGGGDPKLFAAIGAWLGWAQLPFVLLGSALLGLALVLMMRLRGEAVDAASRLPFGTLLAAAAWPVWLVLLQNR